MSYLFLIVGGLLEMVWSAGMHQVLHTGGRTRVIWAAGMVLAMLLSFAFLMAGMARVPVGTAYAIWTGIGAAGAVLVGIAFFQEPADWARMLFALLVVIGIVGLGLRTPVMPG